jgi:outer membrane protein OmpA-like peptidoglycan-associated protein
MRDDSQWFELEVSNQRIRQAVVLGAAIAPLAKKKLFDFEIKANECDQDVAVINQNEEPTSWWKILAALLIGAAFIGTAIAFGVLIKRSDDTKLQKQSIPTVIKESVIESKPPFNTSNKASNNSSPNSLTGSIKSSPNSKATISSNINNSGSNQNSTIQSNQSKSSDRNNLNVNTSILPIANPDIEATIFFPSDESQLRPPEEIKIDNFWAKIQGKRGIVQVSGHSDTTGEYAYNLDLSQARANEVVRLLRDRGLDNNYKITFEALSWVQPLRKNNTATDKAFNRRVVLQFKEQR